MNPPTRTLASDGGAPAPRPALRPTVATLRAIADLHGLPWSDAELEAALPAVTSALAMLASLDTVAVGDLEPTTHFRIV